MGSLATNVILPVFPSMALSLGVEPRDLALTLSSFFIAFAVGQLFVGPLADRFGRKPLVVGGLITFVVGSAVCALAHTLDMLILGRIIQALGACAAIGSTAASLLPSTATAALAATMAVGSALALLVLIPVIISQKHAKPALS